MKKTKVLIFAVLLICSLSLYSQFSKSQMDELTAFGISSAIQPDNHSVINNAKELTAGYGDRDFTQNVCSIFDNIFRNWNYQRYPGGRFVEYASEA